MVQDDPSQRFEIPSVEKLQEQYNEFEAKEESTRIGQVIARHHDALMAHKGVTMLGEGLDEKGRPAIIIGVRKNSDLPGLPSQIEGIPVVSQVTGEITAY